MPTWRTVLMAGALWCGCESGAAKEPWADADNQESPPAENAEVPRAEVPGEGPRASVDVGMDFAGTQVRFNVRVANRSPTGDIVAVVIGRDRRLLERPFGIGKPKGCESHFVKRESPGNPARWEVWLSCDPGVLARVAEGLKSGANLGGEHCGANAILPGDKRAFSLTVLSRRSVGLGPGSVAVLFSGGQTQAGGP